MRRQHQALVAGLGFLLLSMAMGVTFAGASAPVISVGATKAQPLSTEATLYAEVDPGGLETTYRFEYGKTVSYGQTTPARTIAAGGAPVPVEASLFDLGPGSTYHFRLIASNDDGVVEGPDHQFATGEASGADDCPNAAVRAQQGSAFLPDCRAYEMITPADKGGGTIAFGAATAGVGLNQWNGVAASVNGERVAYGAWIRLANGNGGMPLTYRAERGPAGWSSEAVSPRPHDPAAEFHTHFAGWEALTPDLEVGYGDLSQDSFDPTDVNDVVDIYRTGPGEETELVTRGNGAERLGADQGARESITGISNDGSHLFFFTPAHLVPEDADRVDQFGLFEVYDRSRGHTYLLNQTNTGELINTCGSQLGGSYSDEHAVSDDGSKVFFQVPYSIGFSGPDCQEPSQVYMRVNNDETVHVSASQRTVPDPGGTQPANFEGATADGSVVFFSSGEMLTDEATPFGGLYRYDTELGDLELIIPYETATGDWIWPDVTRISADGSRVYFLSYFELAPGAVYANRNLFVWSEDDGIEFVGTSESFELDELRLGRRYKEHAAERTMVITPNGKDALFVTKAQLTPFDSKGRRQVYHYDGDAGKLTCISCDPAGQRPPGSVVRSDATFTGDAERDTPLSADGEVAVFQSGDRLVPQDINNRFDVYEYRDGRLSLITPGREDVDSYLVGMGPSGTSVFVATFSSLVGADKDGGDLDVYVARTGGGFPEVEPTAERPPCEGEGCQGGLAIAPALARPGSTTVSGPGNAKARARKGCAKPRKGKKARRSKAKNCRQAAAPKNKARKGR